MLKPHVVAGHQITKELCDKANVLKLSVSCVSNRIRRMHMTPEEACTTPVSDTVNNTERIRNSWAKQNQAFQKGVKRYFMSHEEIVAKYGEPGKVMYPERLKNNSHLG